MLDWQITEKGGTRSVVDSQVAVLRTRPETVVADYGRLTVGARRIRELSQTEWGRLFATYA